MIIAFLSYGAENLAFQYLSASLKKDNHDVKLFFDPCLFDDKLLLHYPPLNGVFSFTEWILDEIEAYSPDLIGISILTDTFPWAVEFAKAIKTRLPDVKFVVGGTHVTI